MTTRIQDRTIDTIRDFNRFYTRHLGVLEDGYLQSEFTLTQARIIYELGTAELMTATGLQGVLGHNAGYMSRVLRGLGESGLIDTQPSPVDGRERLLSLTNRGNDVFNRLDARSHEMIANDLVRLAPADRRELVRSMQAVRNLLDGEAANTSGVTLRNELRPGDIGWIVQQHGELYAREYEWNLEFEALVAEIGAAFLRAYDPRRERIWIAERNGRRVGCVLLVRHPERDGVAKLRLLLVHPDARGLGLGRRLVDACTGFAREAGYHTITLWTNSVLTGARHIYRSAGYRMIEEEPITSFGHELVSETWELTV